MYFFFFFFLMVLPGAGMLAAVNLLCITLGDFSELFFFFFFGPLFLALYLTIQSSKTLVNGVQTVSPSAILIEG